MSQDDFREPQDHPQLGPEQDAAERGTDPPSTVGTGRPADPPGDPDPNWQPDPDRAHEYRKLFNELGRERRPHREDVYPYLLIRTTPSGDRGKRPTWPPVPCWESPDILLIDASYTGPFDVARLVISPTAGRSYRVFVRIFNLGRVQAIGVHVKAWAINPGFFGAGNQDDPYYRQHLIGGKWTELGDRTRPDSVAVVELDQRWKPDPADVGHHCLIAEVGCPLDPSGGLLLPNNDRHVGQRNLTVLTGSTSLKPMLDILGAQVTKGFALEVTHAGPTAAGTLLALSGGMIAGVEGRARRLAVPQFQELRAGANIGGQLHLLTAMSDSGRTVVAPAAQVTERAVRTPNMARLLRRAGPREWSNLGTVSDAPMGQALTEGLARHFDLADMTARELAKRLGGEPGALHALRFALSDREGHFVGGYTVVVA